MRASWSGPVAWAGLAKVPPNPSVARELLAARERQLQDRLVELAADIADTSTSLQIAAAGRSPGSPAVRSLAAEEQRLLELRAEEVLLLDEQDALEQNAQAALLDPHAHLNHRNMPMQPATGGRARLLSWWAVLSTPMILWTIAQIVEPTTGVSATTSALGGLVVLVSIEGFVRGKFLAVMGRFLLIILGLVVLYYAWKDWRILLAAGLSVAAITLLIVNLREALRR